MTLIGMNTDDDNVKNLSKSDKKRQKFSNNEGLVGQGVLFHITMTSASLKLSSGHFQLIMIII